jgi:hypothetical protein
MEFNYAYSDGTKNLKNWIYGETSNSEKVKNFLDKLTEPKRGVSISFGLYGKSVGPDWIDVDFHVTKERKVHMEIMPYGDVSFANIDISTAKQIVGLMFKLSEIKSFRQELQKVPIKWIC